MVPKRRAAGLDGLIEHVVDRLDQTTRVLGGLALFGRECRRQTSRRQVRTK